MSDVIKVAICDDARFLCDGFREQFSVYPELEVAGLAYSAGECINMLEKADADVLLLDIHMETDSAGIDIIPEIKEQFPTLRVIMLTSYSDDDYVFAAFANGADDYCEKTMPVDDIVNVIKNVWNNKGTLRPEISRKLVKRTRQVQANQMSMLYLYDKISRLSTGEYELLRELYYGNTYKKIAAEKFIEIDSVRKMAKRLLKRMEAKNIHDLLEQLHQLKFFDSIDKL